MLKISPQTLNAISSDLYELMCTTNGAPATYKFEVTDDTIWERSRSISHDDAYYFVTYDDSDGDLLERAILYFDEARQLSVTEGENGLKPMKIEVESRGDSHAYNLLCQQNNVSKNISFALENNDEKFHSSISKSSFLEEFSPRTRESLIACFTKLHDAVRPSPKVTTSAL